MKTIKIKPGSWTENKFLNLLKRNGVKMDLVMKKSGDTFEKPYDEYQLSEGLYRIIQDDFERFIGA